jgi:hypothetical protein
LRRLPTRGRVASPYELNLISLGYVEL